MMTVPCGVCRFPVRVIDASPCARCETRYHRDCWTYNGGCAVFGCEVRAGRPVEGKGVPAWRGRAAVVALALLALAAFRLGSNAYETVAQAPVPLFSPVAVLAPASSRPDLPRLAHAGDPAVSPDRKWRVEVVASDMIGRSRPAEPGPGTHPELWLFETGQTTPWFAVDRGLYGTGFPHATSVELVFHGWCSDSERLLYSRWIRPSGASEWSGELREANCFGTSWPVLDTRAGESLRARGIRIADLRPVDDSAPRYLDRRWIRAEFRRMDLPGHPLLICLIDGQTGQVVSEQK